MTRPAYKLPNDPEKLHAVIHAQSKALENLQAEIVALRTKLAVHDGKPVALRESATVIAGLEAQIAALEAVANSPGSRNGGSQRSGDSSSRRVPRDERKEQTGHGPTPQPDLPVVVEHHVLPEDATCPECGGGLYERAEDLVSQIVEIRPMECFIREVHRHEYICDCVACKTTTLAPGPGDLLRPGGRYSVGFGASIVTDRYLSNLTLHNLVQRFGRCGLEITTATLFDQLHAVARYLEPTYDALRRRILCEDVIGLDQTSWRLLKKGAKTKQIWVLTSLDSIYFAFEHHKDTETGLRLLDSFPGTIVCDDMSTHSSIVTHIASSGLPPPALAGCWAHVRAKFRACVDEHPDANEVLGLINQLFALERTNARRSEESEDEYHRRLLTIRANESSVILAKLKASLSAYRAPPGGRKLRFAKAVRYTLSNWANLTRFVEDPAIWLDNNRSERALRTPVNGRKIHLGSKSARGMRVSSVLYSVTQTCRLLDVDPWKYVFEAVMRAKRDPGAVTLPHDLVDGHFEFAK